MHLRLALPANIVPELDRCAIGAGSVPGAFVLRQFHVSVPVDGPAPGVTQY